MKRSIISLLLAALVVTALIVAQEEETDEPALWLSVAGETCALELVELTPKPRQK